MKEVKFGSFPNFEADRFPPPPPHHHLLTAEFFGSPFSRVPPLEDTVPGILAEGAAHTTWDDIKRTRQFLRTTTQISKAGGYIIINGNHLRAVSKSGQDLLAGRFLKKEEIFRI